jgi:hypothetical protein
MSRSFRTQSPFPRPPVYAAYFAEATKAKKASSFAKASTVAGGYGGQDGGQDDRQAGPTQWLFQGPPAESKFLAAALFILVNSASGLLGNLSSTRRFPLFAVALAVAAIVGGTA